MKIMLLFILLSEGIVLALQRKYTKSDSTLIFFEGIIVYSLIIFAIIKNYNHEYIEINGWLDTATNILIYEIGLLVGIDIAVLIIAMGIFKKDISLYESAVWTCNLFAITVLLTINQAFYVTPHDYGLHTLIVMTQKPDGNYTKEKTKVEIIDVSGNEFELYFNKKYTDKGLSQYFMQKRASYLEILKGLNREDYIDKVKYKISMPKRALNFIFFP